ncbi:MAG TPA: YciI family protein [Edaphobacter sp.]|nr:YciI family protein [Edaphobacter sp.]
MRCMVFVKASKESEAGILPSTELLASMGKFNEELVKAGVMLAGEGLKPSSHGKRVTFTAGKPTITDGPFAETKELVAGFWIWQVRSIEEAVEWLKRSPFGPGAELEIRPVFEAEDFGPNLTPELKEREDRLRKQIGEKKSSNPLKKSFDALSIL